MNFKCMGIGGFLVDERSK